MSLWKGEVWTQSHTPAEERWRKKTGSRGILLQDKEKDMRQLLPPQPSGDNLINSSWTQSPLELEHVTRLGYKPLTKQNFVTRYLTN